MFKKNAFGMLITGMAGKFDLPGPDQTTTASLLCTIDKKNLDAKNPPKNPFIVQIALKTSLDIWYFSVPCKLHCLVNREAKMTKEDF